MASKKTTMPGENPARELVNSLRMKLVLVPATQYMMGSPLEEDGRGQDETQHLVRITRPFMMGVVPVTQAQWRALMGNNPSYFSGDNLPVEQVSWRDAAAFCQKLGEKEGRRYVLPTEAQWECACRAGATGAYAGTGNPNEMGWHWNNAGGKTHAVGLKLPNAWGLYDMHGNVWEWCSDWYGEYGGNEAVDPVGAAEGDARVVRGGAWNYAPQSCRCAARYSSFPGYQGNHFGFRVSLELS